MSETYQRPLAEGEIIDDKYQIETVLGSGGFGITYMATDLGLNRHVAIKEYFPQSAWREQQSRIVRTNDGEVGKNFKNGLNRFHKEGQILARFKHPNIVGVQTIVSANGTAYLVMDYEHGETLESYMNRLGRPLTYDEAEAIFNPLLDGLRAIHDHNLLHLDIKPANIFLCRDTTPVLIDFGGARHQLGQASRAVSFLVASDGFAPNEQYSGQGKQLQPNTDIYAVGATLYFTLTNQIPPDAIIRADAIANVQHDPLTPLTQLINPSEYPAHFLEAITTAISMRSAVRPQNVREFQKRLFQASHVVPPQPPSYHPPSANVPPPSETSYHVAPAPSTNWIPLASLIGGAIILLLGGILWNLSTSSANQTNQTDIAIRKIAEQNAIRAREQEAQQKLREARSKTEQLEAQQKIEEKRQQQAQQKLQEAKLRADQQEAEKSKKKEEELNKLIKTIASYYEAIADGNADSVVRLWKDPSSEKAQKAYNNVKKGGGGSCEPTGESGHEFTNNYTHARLYMEVKCDERRQKRGYQNYNMLFTFDKNYTDKWRITNLTGIK